MYRNNESVVSVFAPERKHVSTEIVRDGTKTIFTITFEEVATKQKELDIPEFMKNRGI